MIFIINKLKNSVKVSFLDKRTRSKFWGWFSVISGSLSFILLFDFFPESFESYKYYFGIACLIVFFLQSMMQNMFSGALYSAAWFWTGMALVLSLSCYLSSKSLEKIN